RRRHPAVSRLSHRRPRRKEYISGNGLLAFTWRTANRRAIEGLDLSHYAPHFHPREHQEVPRRLPLRRPPHGHDDLNDCGTLDILFILHADHEQNCSANTIRSVGSSHVDPYSATAAAIAALYGPLHGGANEEVLRMLMEIGSVQNVPAFIKRVKAGETKLMGF